MVDKNGLELGTGANGKTGRRILLKNQSASDLASLRDVFGYKVDPIDGSTLIFTTLDSAVSACRPSLGDEIIVSEGYTETISSATAVLLDVAGVTITGLGVGSARPTFTFDTATTATIPVSAADVKISNCIFTANFADIVSFFTLTTANNFTLEGNLFKATATNMNALYVVDTDTTTSNANGLTLTNNTWIESDTATMSMVKMDGDNSFVDIRGNFLSLGVRNNTAAIMAIVTAKSVFHARIENNRVYRLNTDTATGAILVTTDQSDNSGIIANNFVQHADTAAELLITASSGFGVFENRASGVAGASGYLLPAADS